MIKCGELSSRHYIKITRLKQVHSISPSKSVISREAVALGGCTGGFVAMAVSQQRGHSEACWGAGWGPTCGAGAH